MHVHFEVGVCIDLRAGNVLVADQIELWLDVTANGGDWTINEVYMFSPTGKHTKLPKGDPLTELLKAAVAEHSHAEHVIQTEANRQRMLALEGVSNAFSRFAGVR
jgi:hypothetical protein